MQNFPIPAPKTVSGKPLKKYEARLDKLKPNPRKMDV